MLDLQLVYCFLVPQQLKERSLGQMLQYPCMILQAIEDLAITLPSCEWLRYNCRVTVSAILRANQILGLS